MRGTEPVTIGQDVVYAYFTVVGRVMRLRLSADECDRLDLFEGRQVCIWLAGREPASALVMTVTPAPPFVWIEVEFAGVVSQAGRYKSAEETPSPPFTQDQELLTEIRDLLQTGKSA